MAAVWGGRQSTGLMLLMPIIGDMFAVRLTAGRALGRDPQPVAGRRRRNAAGALTGHVIDDRQFKILIAAVVLVCLVLMVYREIRGAAFTVPQPLVCFAGRRLERLRLDGGATPPARFFVYLLAIGLNKKNFRARRLSFFMIVNLLKLPSRFSSSAEHQLADHPSGSLLTVPLIYIGIRTGIWLIQKLNEKAFRFLVLGLTLVTAIRLLQIS